MSDIPTDPNQTPEEQGTESTVPVTPNQTPPQVEEPDVPSVDVEEETESTPAPDWDQVAQMPEPEDIEIPDVGRSVTVEDTGAVESESETSIPESEFNEERPHPTYGVNRHINISRPIFSSRETVRKHRFQPFEQIAFFGLNTDEVATLTELNIKILEHLGRTTRDPKFIEYISQLRMAEMTRYEGGAFESSLERENSKWDNTVTSGATKLSIVRPKFEAPSENDRLVGQAAVERMRAHLSLGSVLRVPLWHSGLWVTLKAPTEVALLELQRRITAEKIEVGRQTGGLVFSNASVYIKKYLVDFIMLHVVEATYRYTDVSELTEIIREPDYMALIHGILCTIYPDGYPYSQPCFINPGKCTHTIEETISLPRISFTDTFRLSEKQRAHMTRKNAKFTQIELDAYQAEFGFNQSRLVKLNDTTTMELRLPDLESSLDIGTTWIDQIVARAEKALGPSVPKDARTQFMVDQARVSSMCQYVHFVERIILNEDDERQTIVEDAATISDMLAVATANEEFYQNFYNGMQKYIEDVTISLFAVPKKPCPACSAEDVARAAEEDPDSRYPYLLPLNIEQLFFLLQDRRLTRIFRQDA